jgi:alpha-ketoglutaric semialdehyde dehydrogenase
MSLAESTASVPARHPAHVGGEWVASNEFIEVRDPADWEMVLAQVAALDSDTVTTGFAAAREGARIWGRTNALERAAVLFSVAQILRSRTDSLATLLSRENGKTLGEARGEVGKSAEFFEFYAGLARIPYGELLHDARPGTITSVRREPLGVVLAITPWNDPLLTPSRKIAPALAAGNAVVLKPASDTPLIALELTRVLLEAGLPPQVITTVTGRAAEIGDAILASPEIDAVTFTGSTEVGLDLQRRLAGRNLRIQTEMGGKNAAIVLADADLDLAADSITSAAFAQAGQRCTSTSRVLVALEVKDQLLAKLGERATSLRLGRGTAEGTTVGPLVSQSHRSGVLEHISTAVGQGARIFAGGRQPEDPGLVNGCFVEPTILDEVTPQMRIWHEEVFGPVVAVHRIADLDMAIKVANASEYGLSASLFTRGLTSAEQFLRDIEAGQAAVNLPTSGWDVHHPFGGFKLSGSPFKEQGLEALHFYTRVKTCAVRAM